MSGTTAMMSQKPKLDTTICISPGDVRPIVESYIKNFFGSSPDEALYEACNNKDESGVFMLLFQAKMDFDWTQRPPPNVKGPQEIALWRGKQILEMEEFLRCNNIWTPAVKDLRILQLLVDSASIGIVKAGTTRIDTKSLVQDDSNLAYIDSCAVLWPDLNYDGDEYEYRTPRPIYSTLDANFVDQKHVMRVLSLLLKEWNSKLSSIINDNDNDDNACLRHCLLDINKSWVPEFDDYETFLFVACEKGLEEIVDFLLNDEMIRDTLDFSYQNFDRNSAGLCFMNAANASVAEILLNSAAEEFAADMEVDEINQEFLEKDEKFGKLLAKHFGDSINVNESCGWHDQTPLVYAIVNGMKKKARWLIQTYGDSIDVNDANNRLDKRDSEKECGDALFCACIKGDEDTVQLLLESYPNIIDGNNASNKGRTPLFVACDLGHFGMVRLLMKMLGNSIDINKPNSAGETPIYIAMKKKYREIVSLLLESGKTIDVNKIYDGTTLLHLAIEDGNFGIVNRLIDNFGTTIDFNIVDKDELTPLELLHECKNFWQSHGPDIPSWAHSQSCDEMATNFRIIEQLLRTASPSNKRKLEEISNDPPPLRRRLTLTDFLRRQSSDSNLEPDSVSVSQIYSDSVSKPQFNSDYDSDSYL